MLRQAVILAGGKGTRLKERLNGRPKPLVDVLGTPLLERQVLALREGGITQVLVLVNHEAAQIEAFCASRQHWGIDVQLVDDGEPRGTAGAVLAVLPRLQDEFLVVYGDTLFDVDLERFAAFHAQVPQAAGSLFLHPNDHPADSDIVVLDEHGQVLEFSGYPHAPGRWLPNMVNAALYILRRDALAGFAASGRYDHPAQLPKGGLDFGKHLFALMIEQGQRLRGYVSPEYIKDIGTPGRLDKACKALADGVVQRASLRVKQRAVFLDRDGTLNRPNGHISQPDALQVFDFAAAAIKRLHDAEFRTVLVTNQPVVARGECTERGLQQIHAKLESLLGAQGVFLDRIYHCPHHPHRGYAGEVAALKIDCDCRKPKPGMLLRAATELNIDLGQSWLVGDSDADIAAARAAGVSAVHVATGEPASAAADFSFADALQAADFIAEGYGRLRDLPQLQAALAALQPGATCRIDGSALPAEALQPLQCLAGVLARELRLRGQPSVTLLAGAPAAQPALPAGAPKPVIIRMLSPGTAGTAVAADGPAPYLLRPDQSTRALLAPSPSNPSTQPSP